MGEEEHAGDDWSLSWFLEPFAGSRGGFDTAPAEELERVLDLAEGRGGEERGGE